MRFTIKETEKGFVLTSGKQEVTTPMGTPVASRYRDLLEEVGEDISRYGDDPSVMTSMYSLQATYLDFGCFVPRAELERNILENLSGDYFLHRSADPAVLMPLIALWGPLEYDSQGFKTRLAMLPLRSVMALQVAGAQFGSPTLGLAVVGTKASLTGLSLGACARFYPFMVRKALGKDLSASDDRDPFRYGPYEDLRYCEEVCCTEHGPGKELDPGCPVLSRLSILRKFAAFGEEYVEGLVATGKAKDRKKR